MHVPYGTRAAAGEQDRMVYALSRIICSGRYSSSHAMGGGLLDDASTVWTIDPNETTRITELLKGRGP